MCLYMVYTVRMHDGNNAPVYSFYDIVYVFGPVVGTGRSWGGDTETGTRLDRRLDRVVVDRVRVLGCGSLRFVVFLCHCLSVSGGRIGLKCCESEGGETLSLSNELGVYQL